GFLLLTTEVFRIELLGQLPCLVSHAIVRREEQPGSDVRRAHAAGSIDAWREDEADVVTVDFLPREAAYVEQRAQTDLVRSLREHREAELGDDAILASQ